MRAFGDAGLVVEVDDTDTAQTLAGYLRTRRLPHVVDVVAGMSSVLLVLDRRLDVATVPAAAELAAAGKLPGGSTVVDALAAAGAAAVAGEGPASHQIAVVLDGPDLGEVADGCGLSVGEVMSALAGAQLSVALLGFSPGFAYLRGLEGPLATVTRRSRPRPVVPAGSFAIAGGFAAVYPQATPGGWQLVGRTSYELFDPHVPPFARLRPGDRIRLVPVDELPGPVDAVRPAGDAPGRPVFEVLDPGMLTLVEDQGRQGVAHLGVPRAGAADPEAHWLANRLVGNPSSAAALELTGRGPRLRCLDDVFVAAVGGDVAVAVDGRAVAGGAVLPLGAGQVLELGTTSTAPRAVLAVAGGVVTAPFVGGSSTDVLSGTGPAPLTVGAVVHAGESSAPLGGRLERTSVSASAGAAVTLRVLPGPHHDWFDASVLDELAGRSFSVGADSNRVGLRLVPDDGAPIGRRSGELMSTGMVVGAVQVPPDGVPVVLGPDHATLGGYPVVATVIGADLSLLGRCRPGDAVRLVPVTVPEAADAWRARRVWRERAVVGHYPTASGT
jgi:KipI family sensor histidine kinase inhibitor